MSALSNYSLTHADGMEMLDIGENWEGVQFRESVHRVPRLLEGHTGPAPNPEIRGDAREALVARGLDRLALFQTTRSCLPTDFNTSLCVCLT